MSLFNFKEEDTRIFQYSRGERGDDGQFKIVYADPRKIMRQLDISLPNRSQLIDQHLAGKEIKQAKLKQEAAYEEQRKADPALLEKPIEYTDDEKAMIRMGGCAHEELLVGIRAAFELVPLDESTGQGCTEDMAVAVMNHWTDWLEKKDGSTPPNSTSSPPSPAA